MNTDDVFLNDTFDNLSLTNIEKLITAQEKSQKNSDSTSKRTNRRSILSVQNANSATDAETNNNCSKNEDEISFNDSQFLNDSLSISKENKVADQKEVTEVIKKNIQNQLLNNCKPKNNKHKESAVKLKSNKSINNNDYDKSFNSKTKAVQNYYKESTVHLNDSGVGKEHALIIHNDHIIKNSPKHNVSKHILLSKASQDNILQQYTTSPSNLKLSSWGLPEVVLEKYHSKKIENMFSWQVECLNNNKLLNNSANLVYSAPTSAGKTLVAEILAIKTILERHKKVIFILPFVSIVREKMYYFQDILGSSGVRVEGFMGSYNPPGGFQSVQFAICTIEKANSLINRLLEEGNLSEIGAVLVDEMHLIGDPHRGYMLELLLTKLRYISRKDENVQIQIIGMSATLPNLKDLAKWLDAELFTTSFRPIPLHEQAHVCGEIYDKNLKLIRKLQPLPELGTDTDNILQLCLETIKDSCSVLIFCPTKNWCENLAQQISTAFCKLGRSRSPMGELLRSQLNTDLITELLQQLKYCPVGLDEILCKTVSFGVAFHHAGLTMDERDIVEGAFRNGAVRILIATSTLSSGVNLPARRVIIRTANFHGKPIDTLTYRQMIGRAGRMGKDSVGESFLICQKNDYHIAKSLMSAELQPVESCLEGAGKLKRAILEVIASGVASTPDDVSLFADCTLLASTITDQENQLDIANPIQEALTFLMQNEFVRLQIADDGCNKYVPTGLGKACLSSSIPPDEGLALFTELEKARQCLVLETELHLIYLVTPYSACNSWGNIDWMFYLDLWEKLPPSMKRVGELVGVREPYIVNATRGKIVTTTNKLYQKFLVHKRFFVALALQDLVNEKTLNEVCAKFNCNRGMLQSLQQSASSFAGMITSFSRQLGWSCIEILLSQFQDRMQFGVSRDLLDLMRLPALNGKMARTLYNSGIDTLIQLANSNVDLVENILHKVLPFESAKERDGETEFDKNQRNKLRRVWITGKDGLTEREAAEMLVTDARDYLKVTMGLLDAKWENTKQEPQCDTRRDSGELKASENNVVTEECAEVLQNIADPPICESGPPIHESLESIPDSVTLEKSLESMKIDVSNNTSISSLDLNISNNSSLFSNKSAEENVWNKPQNTVSSKSPILVDEITPDKEKSLINSKILVSARCIDFKCTEVQSENSNGQNENNNNTSSVFDSESCSIFEKIDFTQLEQKLEIHKSNTTPLKFNNVAANISANSSVSLPKKSEVSHILLSSSPVELNISDSSIFSPSGNRPVKLNKNSSTESLLEDSFSLQLSNESSKNVKITFDNGISDNLSFLDNSKILDHAFSSPCIFDDNVIINSSDCCSEDLFNSSLPEESASSKTGQFLTKRSRDSNNAELEETPSKKKKTSDYVSKEKINTDFSNDKFEKSKSTDFTKLTVIDVCKSNALYETFCKELKQKFVLCLSLACSSVTENRPVIGLNTNQEKSSKLTQMLPFTNKNKKLDGFSVTWDGEHVYYVSLENKKYHKDITKLFKQIVNTKTMSIKMFDSKEHIKTLKQCFGLDLNCYIEDPKVADWMLEPEGKEKNLYAMAVAYCPEASTLVQLAGNCKGVGSVALDLHSCIESRIRASVETIATWHIVNNLKKRLVEVNFGYLDVYEIEMKSVLCLAKMEISGMSVSKVLLQKLVDVLKSQLATIEKQAFSLAGRRFNFISSADVAKVVGAFRGKKISMRKTVLEQNDHPISGLVLQWRKINCTLTKMIYPLLQVTENNRIYSSHILHTSTGRITMHEPNLQTVAKDFLVKNPVSNEKVNISCRSAFSAPENYSLLSADYCQLELRILAHLSEDKILQRIMTKPGDVFKSIAAKWNNVSEEKVDDTMRQNTKHLCYGIIYGMGAKALSDQLNVPEDEALLFMETFRNTYPGIKKYIQKTVEKCRKDGYVETITGRRRYLPHINEANATLKSQAERQAVNTTVQGSAADIAKKAMVGVDSKLYEIFGKAKNKPKLTLHLHDELIYEVPDKYVRKVAKIMKNGMENAVELSVPFPVKLKTGPSWGQLSEYNL